MKLRALLLSLILVVSMPANAGLKSGVVKSIWESEPWRFLGATSDRWNSWYNFFNPSNPDEGIDTERDIELLNKLLKTLEIEKKILNDINYEDKKIRSKK